MVGPDRAATGSTRSREPPDAGTRSGTASGVSDGVVLAFEGETAVPSRPHSRASDGGRLLADGGEKAERTRGEKAERTRGEKAERTRGEERPLSERSRRSLETEIDDLEQDLEQYETQDQAVIDRYEGLLAERRRRQRKPETDREDEGRQRLGRIKNQVLRAFGLR